MLRCIHKKKNEFLETISTLYRKDIIVALTCVVSIHSMFSKTGAEKTMEKNTVLEAMVCVSVVCVCMNSSQNKGSRTYIPRWFIQTGTQNSIKKCTKEGISFNSWNPFATRWIRCKRKSLWFGVSAVAERPCPSSTCATISLTNLSHVHSPCNTGFGFFLTLTLETSTFLRI